MYDLQLISIWKAKRTEHSYVNFHNHNYHELVYYLRGSGETTIEDSTYTFADNSFAFIPPHASHDEYHHSDSDVICVEFSGATDVTHRFCQDSVNRIHRILKDLLSEVKNQNYGYKEMIAMKLNELYLHLLRDENASIEEKNFEYMINYLKENYHEKLILTDCARQLNLSYDYFQHTFKKLTGYSPQQFLVQQRLLASKKLLQSGDMCCTEIAYRCGFSTSAQFSALFKREYGQSPLQYRKQNR